MLGPRLEAMTASAFASTPTYKGANTRTTRLCTTCSTIPTGTQTSPFQLTTARIEVEAISGASNSPHVARASSRQAVMILNSPASPAMFERSGS